MPINLTNPVTVSVPVTTEQQVTCDQLWVLSLQTDGSALGQTPPTAAMSLLPFATPAGQPPVFAPPEAATQLRTANLYVAAANVPEIGAALQAVFMAAQAWYAQMQSRASTLVTSQSAADLALAGAAAAETTRDTARLNLYAAEQSLAVNQNPEDSDALHSAVAVAQTALDAAEATLTTAHQKLALANVALQTATLAARDVANPPLVET